MINTVIFVGNNTTGSGADAVRACTQLGLRPVVLTTEPGRHEADVDAGATVIRLSEWSHPEMICKSRDLTSRFRTSIVGVTTFSDPRVALAAELARSLGLRGLDPAAAAECLDKIRQRRILDAAAVAGPRWRIHDGPISGLRFPVVVKPARGSGSVGVRLALDLAEAGRMAAGLSSGELTGKAEPEILIEEYIDGPQYSVEIFNDRVIGVTANHIGEAPTFIETGHDFPAPLGAKALGILGDTAARAVRALRVNIGPSHVELRMGADGPRVIEVNPRLAGGLIPELVKAATGIDLIECTLRAAIGENIVPTASRSRAGALRNVVAPRRGRFGGVPRVLNEGVSIRELRRHGEVVGGFGDFRDRVACIIAVADDLGDATLRADDARSACAAHASIEPETQ